MTAKVLRRAAEIVEQGWCQGPLAKHVRERGTCAVSALSPNADLWCVWGALDRAVFEITGEIHSSLAIDAGRATEPVVGHGFLTEWNDAAERTQAEVVDVLRRAAALAEGDTRA